MAPVAMITGASSGIGTAFGHALAERGFDLVLVARRRDRLEHLAAELHAEHGITVEVLVADLSDSDALETVERRMDDADRPVDMLVNNAGAGIAGSFAEIPLSDHLDQLSMNATAVMRLTYAAARAMLPRRNGSILNVSSLGGLAPAPRFASYGAAKSFVVSLTEALHEELRSSGIRVTCLCPGPTRTEFGAHSGATGDELPRLAWMTADDVARAGLAALDRNQALCVTGPLNKVIGALTHTMPRAAVRRVSGFIASRL